MSRHKHYDCIVAWAEGLCNVGDLLYTTPQRQQPLKQLDSSVCKRLWEQTGYSPSDYSKAIMNAMQELNK